MPGEGSRHHLFLKEGEIFLSTRKIVTRQFLRKSRLTRISGRSLKVIFYEMT